jgi:hypothetical protein
MKKHAVAFAAILTLVAGVAFGGGMMGSRSSVGAPGWGMMGGWWDYSPPGAGKALTIDQAAGAVQKYLKDFWGSDLVLAEVMEFDSQFYAEVEEKSTEVHAFELLVNRWTGSIVPEPGPNMMWNTKYGHMGAGMMGGGMMGGPGWGWGGSRGYRSWSDANREMTVTAQKARQYAQEFLDTRLPGTTVEEGVDTFYGYYTIHVMKDEKVYGMLGVNGYTGWVWYHEWHGKFVQLKEIEAMK